jgi:hypothetical protein
VGINVRILVKKTALKLSPSSCRSETIKGGGTIVSLLIFNFHCFFATREISNNIISSALTIQKSN